ncbi:nitronate monooxygenase [Aeromicrobium alkaliterrae]|uniref:Nitronate monooxygenase n=1 Tax=Aeromicrobium alkaliterrae TaxID=302168 RepID=A0ABP4W8K5_9ACTN
MSAAPFRNRLTEQLGITVPVLSAPMGWVARAPLVAAVSEAGGLGLVPGSLDLATIEADLAEVRSLTDRPFGVNIPIAFAQDPAIVGLIADAGVRFVTTSAGSPARFIEPLKEIGVTVFHVVPTLATAEKAIAAGVDGLVVEGSEGGGFKNPAEVSTMVLVPLLADRFDVPIVAAGGIADGRTMLAAMVLGAEGVQMGTRMLASRESSVHAAVKDAILGASEADTFMLNRTVGRPMRVLRTATSELADGQDVRPLLARITETYHDGDLDASLLQAGQVAGRIDSLETVAEILREAVASFDARLHELVRGRTVDA